MLFPQELTVTRGVRSQRASSSIFWEKKIFMHKCPTSGSRERAKDGVWGSESTRQGIGP